MDPKKYSSKKNHSGQINHDHHDHEHDYWSRRSFIQALGLVGGGSILMGQQAVSAAQATPLTVALSESQNDNILIIIRLNGGNDGLNTIVPVYDYATYANLRPNIRHFEPNLMPLNDDFSLRVQQQPTPSSNRDAFLTRTCCLDVKTVPSEPLVCAIIMNGLVVCFSREKFL